MRTLSITAALVFSFVLFAQPVFALKSDKACAYEIEEVGAGPSGAPSFLIKGYDLDVLSGKDISGGNGGPQELVHQNCAFGCAPAAGGGGTHIATKKSQCDGCSTAPGAGPNGPEPSHCDQCCGFFCNTANCTTRCCAGECGSAC